MILLKNNQTKIMYILMCSIIIISISIYLTKNEEKNIKENYKNLLIENQKMPEQIDLLTYSKFDPQCCPHVYSNSHGCLCNNHNENLAIITRGGNK